MPGYVNNENTIGFYKFGNSTWDHNSILNSIPLNWQASETISIRNSPNRGPISHPGNIEKNKYKSRPSSLCIKESNCIWTTLPSQIGNSMTTEFWFYPKYLGNTLSVSNGIEAGFPTPSNPENLFNSLQMTNPFLFNYGIYSDWYRNYRTWGFYT